MLGAKCPSFPTISNGSIKADTFQGKMNMLNNFFYSCFNRSCPSLTLDSLEPALQLQASLDPANFPEDLKCSSEYVGDMLATLDISKSSGPDGPDDITSLMLKQSSYSIAPGLTQLTTHLP